MADRVLQRHGGLLLDTAERQELALDLDDVLKQIRRSCPAVAEVKVRSLYAPGRLILGLETALFETVSSLLEGRTEPVVLRTGNREFDALNARLNLADVDVISGLRIANFYYHEDLQYLNVPAAAKAYEAIEGIEFAEADGFVGDGSDIDLAEAEEGWYVVVRRAAGDCPSGCIDQQLYFLIVDGDDVEQIGPAAATNIPEFDKLIMIRKWRAEEYEPC